MSEMTLSSLPVIARGTLPWCSNVTSTGLIGNGGLGHIYARNVSVHAGGYCSMPPDESASCASLFADKHMRDMAIHTSVSMMHAYD